MERIILPSNFIVTLHSAQRFLERIILKKSYTEIDEEIAMEIIRNILTQRILKYKKIDQHTFQIKYLNVAFIYSIDEKAIVTIYESEDKNTEKVEWIYKFPTIVHFKSGIDSKSKVQLITKGFIPIYKEGSLLVGHSNSKLYYYELNYSVINLAGENIKNNLYNLIKTTNKERIKENAKGVINQIDSILKEREE